MKIDANSIDELFQKSGELEKDLRIIDELIMEVAPELKRQLFAGSSITMMGYGEMSWKNHSSSGVWPLIGVAPQKGGISMYVAAEKDGQTLAQFYNKKRLGKVNNGKNCIRFKRVSDISLEQLKQSVLDAMEWSKIQEREYGRNCARAVDVDG